MAEEKRISCISKSICRKFNTDKYENLDISVSFEENIEWSDLKERNKKSENITKLLLADYEKTKDQVFEELGLKNVKATKNNALKEDTATSVKELGLDDLG